MSALGVVMLVHTALHRAEQIARHWLSAGCPVVIHIDGKVDAKTEAEFRARFAGELRLRFSERHRCEWGGWGIVAASQSASELLLYEFPEVEHVFLASGSCLPLRPVSELQAYLAARPDTDFIESATIADVQWIVGGLSDERFTLRFPFSWKRQRWLFDRYVELQRKIGRPRQVPDGLTPHMGSQWWCLTRKTLTAILGAPERDLYDAYFRYVWIPDESYYQTLARRFSTQIESRSLTLAKFDYQGKPHVFYDDHLQLLRRSDCFVARKIWPNADKVFDFFLGNTPAGSGRSEPNPGKIDRIFSKAVERRTLGRSGLYMQSRFPRHGAENGRTAEPYCVFQGFTELFQGFEPWLAQVSGAEVHGHLFGPGKVEFAQGVSQCAGGLTESAKLRDHNPRAFLTNLLWMKRGTPQAFQYGPRDTQRVNSFIAGDSNAQISIITGAWALPLHQSGGEFAKLRRLAARFQRVEAEQIKVLRSSWVKARVRIWPLAEFIEAPADNLHLAIDGMGQVGGQRVDTLPKMVDLDGFRKFLQDLKNGGMHPYLIGDFVSENRVSNATRHKSKPYLTKSS